MDPVLKVTLALLALFTAASAVLAEVAPSERRMALVIGNASYQSRTLPTAANDAGLIAQTLQAAGFDVVGARDLNENSLRGTFRDFVDSASKSGPDTVVAVYFAGYGLQLEGENYLLPVDANFARDSDIPVRALRLSDYTRALAALHLKATIVVMDAARASPFSLSGEPLAGGLAWVEPESDMLIAFNATPGTVAPEGHAGYGPYAKALAEMIRNGGLSPADVFGRVRLRVNEVTNGAQVPWSASKIVTQFKFFERGPGAPPRIDLLEQTASMRSRPMSDLSAQDAYMVALLRDTFDGYADFLANYWLDPMAKQVRAILAARREAITWRRTHQADTPEAYWSYLKRYPRGSHAADARRLLAHLSAAPEPPPKFTMIEYDIPSPLPDEVKYFERPVLVLNDPIFAFAPPPPLPDYLLGPPPPEFVRLEPPPPPFGAHILPVPVFVPVPAYISAPAYVVAPPNSLIFNKIHDAMAINNTTNVVTITKPSGRILATAPTSPSRAADGASTAAVGPAPPPSVAPKTTPNPTTTGAIQLLPGQRMPTMFSATAPPTGNQPLATPPVATLLLPATGNKPPPNPPAAMFSPPVTFNEPLPNPLAAILTPPSTSRNLQPIPPVATLSLSPTGNEPLPAPPAATRSPTITDSEPSSAPPAAMLAPPAIGTIPPAATLAPSAGVKIPLPIPRPPTLPQPATGNRLSLAPHTVTLSPPPTGNKLPANPPGVTPSASVHQAAPGSLPVGHQPAPAAVHAAAPSSPPTTAVVRQALPLRPAPAPPPQAAARPPSPPVAAAKPPEKACGENC
jgi:uncharacterized caspase-like protein